VLSQDSIRAFVSDGYVALRGAVPAATVQACQDVIWSRLRQHGVLRAEPASWRSPVVRINCPEGGPFAAAGLTPLIREACDQLIGAGRWWRRDGIGGTIPVRFPSEADPGDTGWHIEGSYEVDGRSWVNLFSRARGLLALYLLTDVEPDGAPTRLRPGSQLDVPPLLAPAGDRGRDWSRAARDAARASAHRPTALATGSAGDVFLCHPFLVHAASWPHRGRFPRMIAQPAVALHGQYPLQPGPGGELAPVEQAIVSGLAAAGIEAGVRGR
jgi:Phytanoyl-CoA dioxygenase (PhyH)